MPSSRLFHHLAPVILGLLTPAALTAGTAPSDPPAPPPAEAAPTSPLWEWTVTPYGWLSSIDAHLAARGYAAETFVGIDEILDHLDAVAMLNLEGRRGRWGGWLDGIYLKMSSEADTPGPLLESLDITSQSLILEAALYYRLWEGAHGFVDLYAGARYTRAETDLAFHPSDSGIQEVADDLSRRMIDAIASEVRQRAESAVAGAKAAAAQRARSALDSALLDHQAHSRRSPRAQLARLATAAPELQRSLRRSRALHQAIDHLVASRLEQGAAEASAARATAQNAVATVRQAEARAVARARQAATTAERRLAKTLARELKDAIPDEISQTGDWVDPFVGLRARYNFNDRFYATAKADIGGFGVGSELTWQAYAALGWRINPRLSTEIGYRIMDIDYEGKNGFNYDIDLSGVMVSASLHF